MGWVLEVETKSPKVQGAQFLGGGNPKAHSLPRLGTPMTKVVAELSEASAAAAPTYGTYGTHGMEEGATGASGAVVMYLLQSTVCARPRNAIRYIKVLS